MLSKFMVLAAMTAVMLVTHATTYAAESTPMPVSKSTPNPPRIDGRTILPSIPPMPPLAEANDEPEVKASKAPARKVSNKSVKRPASVKDQSKARVPKARTSRTKARRGR